MRADVPCWTSFALYFLISTSIALPYTHFPKQQTEALAARASYSVVPVDGGAASTGGADGAEPTVTVISTTTETAPAPPPATVTFVKTQLITAAAFTTMSISTTTANKEMETVKVTITHDVATAAEPTPPGLTSKSSTLKATSIVFDATITQATTITKSYDNGQWHTTYPAWSNSSTTISSPEHVPTVV